VCLRTGIFCENLDCAGEGLKRVLEGTTQSIRGVWKIFFPRERVRWGPILTLIFKRVERLFISFYPQIYSYTYI